MLCHLILVRIKLRVSKLRIKLNCLTKGCDASYIGESKRICNIRMENHANDPKSHVHESHVHTSQTTGS